MRFLTLTFLFLVAACGGGESDEPACHGDPEAGGLCPKTARRTPILRQRAGFGGSLSRRPDSCGHPTSRRCCADAALDAHVGCHAR